MSLTTASILYPTRFVALMSSSQVEAEVLEELRGPKVIVYKMKPKKHYRKKQGHRQDLTRFKVTSISA